MIHRKYSGDEEILYQVRFLSSSYLQILHLQVYDPKSLDKQEILFKRLSSPLYNEELKKLKEILYNRFMLLKQGQNPVISDELRDYLKSELSLHFDFGKVPVRNNTAEQEKTVTGTNHLDDVELTSFIQQETKQMRITSAMAERLARENTDPSLAEGILNALQRPGVPGVVDTILLYVSTLEKKNRANQRLWLQLLTFDQMAELREREKKQFGIDLFANSGFRGRYMDRFGDYQPDASSDAKLAACETADRLPGAAETGDDGGVGAAAERAGASPRVREGDVAALPACDERPARAEAEKGQKGSGIVRNIGQRHDRALPAQAVPR